VELLHLFMLVHDDVMDNASLRRNKPTLRVALQRIDPSLEWVQARDLAVVMGNLLNVLAMRHLMPLAAGSAGEAAACELVLESCCRAGAGQFQDLCGWRGLGDDEEALRRELVDKTAYHTFAAPFGAGLRLSSPAADPAPAIAWGCHMGLAFQAIDDLTDLVSPPTVTGKDAMRDLLEGRPSLPLLLLRRTAVGDEREFLDSLVGEKMMGHGERAQLERLIRKHAIVRRSADYVHTEIAEAARIGTAAGFAAPARDGMALLERSLRAYLDDVAAQAEPPSEG
jgi:geranylgeranyl diphosphate synthase type I